MAKWLRRWTANPLDNARMGSNPDVGRLGAAIYYATEQDVGDIKGSQRQDVHATWEHGMPICLSWSKGSNILPD